MHVIFFSLALMAAIPATGTSDLIVLENASGRPFEYRFYFGYQPQAGDPWTAP